MRWRYRIPTPKLSGIGPCSTTYPATLSAFVMHAGCLARASARSFIGHVRADQRDMICRRRRGVPMVGLVLALCWLCAGFVLALCWLDVDRCQGEGVTRTPVIRLVDGFAGGPDEVRLAVLRAVRDEHVERWIRMQDVPAWPCIRRVVLLHLTSPFLAEAKRLT